MRAYIHCLLSDCGGPDSDDAWKVVEDSRAKTISELNVSPSFLDHLQKVKVMSAADKDKIAAAKTPEKKAKLVIRKLEERDRAGFDGFCRALQASEQLALFERLQTASLARAKHPGEKDSSIFLFLPLSSYCFSL